MATFSPTGDASISERDPDACAPKGSSKDQQVLQYLTTQVSGSLSSRPGTSSTRTSSRPSTARSSSASSMSSNQEAILQAVKPCLNVFNIDEVKATLRAALEDENRMLLADVEYLQSLLEEETDLQLATSRPAPSEADLKEYKQKLDDACWKEEQRVKHERHTQKLLATPSLSSGKAGRLRNIVKTSRSTIEPQPSAVITSKSGSMLGSNKTKDKPPDDGATVNSAMSQRTKLPGPSTALGTTIRAVPPPASSNVGGDSPLKRAPSIPQSSSTNKSSTSNREERSSAISQRDVKSLHLKTSLNPELESSSRSCVDDRHLITDRVRVKGCLDTSSNNTSRGSKEHSTSSHSHNYAVATSKHLKSSSSASRLINLPLPVLRPLPSTPPPDASSSANADGWSNFSTSSNTPTLQHESIDNFEQLQKEWDSVQGGVASILQRRGQGVPDRVKASAG